MRFAFYKYCSVKRLDCCLKGVEAGGNEISKGRVIGVYAKVVAVKAESRGWV